MFFLQTSVRNVFLNPFSSSTRRSKKEEERKKKERWKERESGEGLVEGKEGSWKEEGWGKCEEAKEE
jgi:hypothetical protein